MISVFARLSKSCAQRAGGLTSRDSICKMQFDVDIATYSIMIRPVAVIIKTAIYNGERDKTTHRLTIGVIVANVDSER